MSPSSPFLSNGPYFIMGGVVVLAILGYVLFAAGPYLLGPSLTVHTPLEGSSIQSSIVSISGKTARVSYLSINDLPVPLLEDGSFVVERTYPPGYTVIVVRARDRFGREVVKTVQFLHTSNNRIHDTEKEVNGAEAESPSN